MDKNLAQGREKTLAFVMEDKDLLKCCHPPPSPTHYPYPHPHPPVSPACHACVVEGSNFIDALFVRTCNGVVDGSNCVEDDSSNQPCCPLEDMLGRGSLIA